MLGLTSILGLAVVGLYLYVAVAATRGELKTGASFWWAFTKGFTWPATIWNTVDKLYLSGRKG